MSLVFAAIAPHPPLLIPSIGKQAVKKIEKTQKAYEQLEQDLYLSRPEILIVISPHGSHFSDAFTLNVAHEFQTDLREFGDLSTKLKFQGEMNLSSYIRESGKEQKFPMGMISETNLDHGTSVPLFFLTRHLADLKLMQLGFSDLDWKTHVDFGVMIKEKVLETNKRVAIVASADLSHALITEAPAGFNKAGAEFDKKIQEFLAHNNLAGMLQLDKKLVKDAAECGFRSILILMGILQGIHNIYKQYAYEAPFGVGYLTANFALSEG
ncbi:MAG: class III extradiol dioxygenase subunit B-like domain-containing protein [Patescibacteria group bacterium]